MYGILHVELQHYLETRYGRDLWTDALKKAGLTRRIYMSHHTYPDEEAVAIMKATAALTETPAETLFEDFGAFVVPVLMTMYEPLIPPKWRMMELMLNLEDVVYRVIRTRTPAAHPPRMQCERLAPRQLRLTYASPRRMPALARGFIKGLAAYYNEAVDVHEEASQNGTITMTITLLES
jgi:hypothetical protein